MPSEGQADILAGAVLVAAATPLDRADRGWCEVWKQVELRRALAERRRTAQAGRPRDHAGAGAG